MKKTRIDFSGLEDLEKKLKTLESSSVDFGYVNSGIHSKAGIPYASLAALLEWGNDKIPPRPAFRDSIERLKVKHKGFEYFVGPELGRYMMTRTTSPKRVYDETGKYLVDIYRTSMEDWFINGSMNRKNAQLTIELKGFNKPYVETGELVNHVDYRIR